MQTVILDYIDSVDNDVLTFVDEVERGESWKGKKISIGVADEKMINDIWEAVKTQVAPESEIIISDSTIEHIIKRHGKRGEAYQSMRDNRDIARIPYIIQNYDSAESGQKQTKGIRIKMALMQV